MIKTRFPGLLVTGLELECSVYDKGSFNNYIDKKGWVGGYSNVYVGKIDIVKMGPKSLLLSTRGRWVVEKGQNFVYVVIERTLKSFGAFVVITVVI